MSSALWQACKAYNKRASASRDECLYDNTQIVIIVCISVGSAALIVLVVSVLRFHASRTKMGMVAAAFHSEKRKERDLMAVTCHEVRNPLNGARSRPKQLDSTHAPVSIVLIMRIARVPACSPPL